MIISVPNIITDRGRLALPHPTKPIGYESYRNSSSSQATHDFVYTFLWHSGGKACDCQSPQGIPRRCDCDKRVFCRIGFVPGIDSGSRHQIVGSQPGISALRRTRGVSRGHHHPVQPRSPLKLGMRSRSPRTHPTG